MRLRLRARGIIHSLSLLPYQSVQRILRFFVGLGGPYLHINQFQFIEHYRRIKSAQVFLGLSTYCWSQFKHKWLTPNQLWFKDHRFIIFLSLYISFFLSLLSSSSGSYNDPNKHLFCCRFFGFCFCFYA